MGGDNTFQLIRIGYSGHMTNTNNIIICHVFFHSELCLDIRPTSKGVLSQVSIHVSSRVSAFGRPYGLCSQPDTWPDILR